MRRHLRKRLWFALFGLGVVLGFAPQFDAVATTRKMSQAAVIVQTDTEVKKVCVRFIEDSLSGKELLDRAGVDPVYRYYAEGTAVCALCGKGCPADESCLTCGGSKFWAYNRAPNGTGKFTSSGRGASNTRVHNGDVEGWRWGSGAPPEYSSVETICGGGGGETPTTAARVIGPPAPTAGGSGPSSRGNGAGAPSTRSRSPGSATTSTVLTGSATNPIVAGESFERAAGAEDEAGTESKGSSRPGIDKQESDTGKPWVPVVSAGVVLAGLAAIPLATRRSTRRSR